MLPASRNLTLYQGDSFTMTVRLRDKTVDGLAGNPVDLTGCTARAQIRSSAASNQVITEFTCTISNPLTGLIDMELTPSQTSAGLNGVWDVQVTFPDTRVQTYAAGSITTVSEVTRGT